MSEIVLLCSLVLLRAFGGLAVGEGLYGVLEMSEFQGGGYELEIASFPTSEGTILSQRPNDQSNIRVYSSNGQPYSCHIPPAPQEYNPNDALIDGMENVMELLAPLKDTCHLIHEGWWTYEYCHGKKISQFHLEKGNIIGPVLTLGYFEKEKEWTVNELQDTINKRRKGKHLEERGSVTLSSHVMYYTNGTFCHYTQSFRSVVAKIVCSPFHNNTEIIYIDEHPTCRYTVIVHTPQLCQHPLFGSHNYISPPSTIRCTPIVPEAVYKQYLAGMDNNEVPAAVYKEEEQKRQFPLVDVLEVLANSIAEKVGDELGSDGDITGNVDENGEGTLSQEAETVIDKLIDDTLGGMLSVSNVNKNGGDSSNENNNENVHENNEQKVTEKTVSIGKNDDNEAVDRKKKGRVRFFHVKLNSENSLEKDEIDSIIDQITNDDKSDLLTSEQKETFKKSPVVVQIDLTEKTKSNGLLADAVNQLINNDIENDDAIKQRLLEKNYKQSWDSLTLSHNRKK